MKNRYASYLSYLILLLVVFCKHSMDAQIQFIENKGQWLDKVAYRTDLPGGALFLERDCFTFNFYDHELLAASHANPRNHPALKRLKWHAYKIHFIGSNTKSIIGQDKNIPYYNYYLGDDPSRWVDSAQAFSTVAYQSIYHNIDLKIYHKNSSIKYDFIVKPRGKIQDIVMLIDGIERPLLRNDNLVLTTQLGEIIEQAPFAYQLIDGVLKEISCEFVLKGHQVTFRVGEYNQDYPVVIDPEIVFSTYSGSAADNWGFTATDDNSGNLIGGSIVFGSGYPTTTGAYDNSFNQGECDVAITKFNASGSTQIFSTYLGGNGEEMPHSMIADSDNNIIVMGTTGSLNFPTTTGAFQATHAGGPPFSLSQFVPFAEHSSGCDFFISKFSASGTMSASTFVGGNGTDGLNSSSQLFHNYGDLFRGEVIVDQDDNILVSSVTNSTNFPTQNAAQSNNAGNQDAVGFKLNPNLSTLLWSTYLGGSNDDAAYSIQVSDEGNIAITGGTKSTDFPVTTGSANEGYQGQVDGFITKFNSSGNVIDASILLGTSDYDQCYFVQFDTDNNIYVIGQSEGDMPISGNVYNNVGSGQFIRKYTTDLSSIEWSTVIGSGNGVNISLSAFLVSDCGQIYFSGWGGSTNSSYAGGTTNGLPITPDAYQTTTDGSDFYLCVLNNDAETLSYATFFGGSTSHEHVDGGTSKFDKNGSVYQAVCAGCGGHDDFPYTPGAWSSNNASSNCNLGVFKFDLNIIQAVVDINGPNEICEGQVVPIENYSTGADEFHWTFGDGNSSDEFNPNYQYDSYGDFTIQLIASSAEDCVDPDTASINITVLQGVNPTADTPDPICPGGTVQLQGYGTANLHWANDPLLSDPTIPNPTATVDQETTFYLIDSNECEVDTVAVQVVFYDNNTSISEDQTVCIGSSITLEATGGTSYQWTPAATLSNPSSATPIATPTENTTYTVTITTPENCEIEESVDITVVDDFPGGNVYDDIYMCINTSAELEALDGFNWYWTPGETLNSQNIQNPTATPSETTTYFVEVENICGSGTDEVTVYVITPNSSAGDDGVICQGEKHPVWATGGVSYLWTPVAFFDEPLEPTTLASPTESGYVTVTVTDEFGCSTENQLYIEVLSLPGVNAGGSQVVDIAETISLQGIAEGEDYWWTPAAPLSCSFCLAPELTPTEDQWFTLHTVDFNGCENVDSLHVQVSFPIYVPNAFTPNGDGINDYFRVVGQHIENYKITIYNRWGQVIHRGQDITEVWDGSYLGGQYYVPNGVYNWVITYDYKLLPKEIRGFITIIR